MPCQNRGGLEGPLLAENGSVKLWGSDEAVVVETLNAEGGRHGFVAYANQNQFKVFKQENDTFEEFNIYHEGNKPTVADVGALPLTGGTLMGDFSIEKSIPIFSMLSPRGSGTIVKNASDTADYGSFFEDTDANGNKAAITLNAASQVAMLNFNNGNYNIYHEGNKPTAAQIGAVPRLPVYYGANDNKSVDDLLDPFALIVVNSTLNTELQAVIGGTFAYVFTYFYSSVSTTSRRMQVAYSYNAVPHNMAFRIYSANGWSEWRKFSTMEDLANYLPLTGGTLTGHLTVPSFSTTNYGTPIEIGAYIDFHTTNDASGTDYAVRLQGTVDGKLLLTPKNKVGVEIYSPYNLPSSLGKFTDTRAVATKPNDYNDSLKCVGIKQNSTIGSPSTDSYSYVIGTRMWSDSSGGKSHEFALNDSGVFTRRGSTTSWESWEKIVTSDNSDVLNKKLVANSTAAATITTKQLRNIYAGTDSISSLTAGDIYLQY